MELRTGLSYPCEMECRDKTKEKREREKGEEITLAEEGGFRPEDKGGLLWPGINL